MTQLSNDPAILPFVATLRRLLKPAGGARAGDRCELCGARLSDGHRHVVDTRTRRILCACELCGTPEALVGGYRAVPARYVRLPRMAISQADWDALAIPVGLAFFFFNSALGRIVACYPGPAGAAESLLTLGAWPALVTGIPSIHALVPDVEAVLVRRMDDEYVGWIVPIDACYELVGRIRSAWTGFTGGDQGQQAIDEFFAALVEKSATPDPGILCARRHVEART
jgi:hypothetical protein